MAPDRDQVARRLERLDDAALLELTPRVPQAFGVFFARHQDAVVAFLTRQAGSREVAAEVTAETFAVLLESVDRYDPRRGDARGWLFGVARITMLASLRNQRAEDAARRRLGVTVAGHSEEAWDEVESRIDAALPGLLAGVDALPRAERNAVLARIVEERDYADIADSEHANEAAIRQRVRRGLARLRSVAEGGR
ncbi:MAG: sigma-70 family RNA polymerase sigma factor [Solirubrobacterales bacterium]|nr:sigma-70 family RNA polymerase sigma factor [Solirubrobacterales bacterium]